MKKAYILLFLIGIIVLGLYISQLETKKNTEIYHSYDPSKVIYIAMGISNQTKVIDPITDNILDTLPANNYTHGIGVTPDGKYIFTANMKKSNVVVTDISLRKIIKKIDVGGGTHHIAITPNGKTVFASVPSKSGIAVIDVQSLEMTDFIKTGKGSDYIAISRDGKKAYVTNRGDNSVSVIDIPSKKEIAKIQIPIKPDHIAINYDGDLVYVALKGSDEVAVINTSINNVSKRIKVGKLPHGISITRDDKKVYVSNSEEKTISVIDTSTNKVIKEIPLDGNAEHIEIIPVSEKLYASGEDVIWVIDTKSDTVKNRIKTGESPHQIAIPLGLTGYRDITPQELKTMLSKEDIFLVDTHIPEQKHIKGTDAFIPFNAIDENLDKLPNDKNTKIVAYCRSGSMSVVASKKLVELGYTNVYNLLGGTNEWRKLGYEFE